MRRRRRRKIGRPAFKVTPKLRKRVSIAAAGGMAHQDIADALSISRPTLEKHFERELSIGACERRIEVIESLHDRAKGGNVSAAKAFLAMEPKLSAPPAPKEPTLGKKQRQAADARTADVGSDWETDLRGPSTTPGTVQ